MISYGWYHIGAGLQLPPLAPSPSPHLAPTLIGADFFKSIKNF
jgi:hypothetical protein